MKKRFSVMKKEAERNAPRYFQCEVKEVTQNEEGVKIAGFASTPDIDRVQDIVIPTAFERSIKEFMDEDGAPALLRSHDRDKVVGSIIMKGDEAPKITEKGLFITALVTEPDTAGKVTRGEMKTFSIGYIPDWNSVKYELRPTEKVEKESGQRLMIEVRIIEQLDWIETSIVSTPANRKALFTLAKSVQDLFTSYPSPVMKHKCHYFPEETAVGKIGDRWVSQKAIDMLEFKGEATHADMIFDSEEEAKAYVEANPEIKDCDIEDFAEGKETKYKLVDIEVDQKKVDEKKDAIKKTEAKEEETEGKEEEKHETTETAPEQEPGGKTEEVKPEGGAEGEKSLKLTPEVIKSLSDIVALVNPEAAKAMIQDTKAKEEEKAPEITLYDVVMPLMKMLAEHIGTLQKEVDSLKSQPTHKGKTYLAIRSRGFNADEKSEDDQKLDKGFGAILREAQRSSGQSVTMLDTDEEKDDDESDE
jgi:hypothetical protein